MNNEYLILENLVITPTMVDIISAKEQYNLTPIFFLVNQSDGLHFLISDKEVCILPSLELSAGMKANLDVTKTKTAKTETYILASISCEEYLKSVMNPIEIQKLANTVAINHHRAFLPEYLKLEFYICKNVIRSIVAPFNSSVKFSVVKTISILFGLIKSQIPYTYSFRYDLCFNSENLGSIIKGYTFLYSEKQEECIVYIDKDKCNFNILSLVRCCDLMSKVMINSQETHYFIRKKYLLEKTFFAMIELITKSYNTDAIYLNEITIEEVCYQAYEVLNLMFLECKKEIQLINHLAYQEEQFIKLGLNENINSLEVYQNCKIIQAYLKESIAVTDNLLNT